MTKILVIEDDELVRDEFCSLLDDEGFEIYEASSGEEAILVIPQIQPDLILCDVIMPPGMDGYAVLEVLKSSEQTNLIPFIFLTAKASKADIRKGMNLGAMDYITKPATRTELLSAIAARLDLVESVKQLIETREKNVRQKMLKEIPDRFGNLLNDIMGTFQLLKDENDPIKRQKLINDGLKASGEFYGLLWGFFRAIGRS